jgi:hypothetical protein
MGGLGQWFESPPGNILSVEFSDDLKSWAPLQTLTNWLGRCEVVDSGASNTTQRFYRAIKQ